MPRKKKRSAQEEFEAAVGESLRRLEEGGSRGQLFTEVIEIIRNLLDRVQDRVSAKERSIGRELAAVASMIERAKEDVDSIRPQDIHSCHLKLANGELGAISSHLEEATGEILDACEAIESALSGAPPEVAEKVQEGVVRIYEACNFQDITGQRIRKVLDTLQMVEGRIVSLLETIGGSALSGVDSEKAEEMRELTEEEKLLNGPALPGSGTSQDEIDAMFG